MFHLLIRKRVDLRNIFPAKFIVRPAIIIACSGIYIFYGSGCRINQQHDGVIVLEYCPVALFAIVEALLFPNPLRNIGGGNKA